MITVDIQRHAALIRRTPGPELLHAIVWLGLVPLSVTSGEAGSFVALLGLAPMVWLSPTVFRVLKSRSIVLDAASRQVRFIDALGRDQAGLALRLDTIREIVVREVTDADCPLYQVALLCEGGISELTAGGVSDERQALMLCDAAIAFLRDAGVAHVASTRSSGKAFALHWRGNA